MNTVTLSLERYHEIQDAYKKYDNLGYKNVVITKHTNWGDTNIVTIETIDEVTLKMLRELNEAKEELSYVSSKYNNLDKEYKSLVKQFDDYSDDYSDDNTPWYKRIFKKV